MPAIVTAAALSLGLGLVALKTLPIDVALPALAVVWLGMLPMLLFLQGNDGSAFPFLPAIGFYYLLFFGLPLFATPLAYHLDDKIVLYHRVLDPIAPRTVWLVAAGIALLLSAFYLTRFRLARRIPAFSLRRAPLSARQLSALYWVLIFSSLTYRMAPVLQELPSIGQFFEPVGFLAMGGLYLQWRRGALTLLEKVLFLFIALPLDLYLRAEHLYLTAILFVPLFFMFVMWRERQFKVMTGVLMAFILIALTYNITTATRYAGNNLFDKLSHAAMYTQKIFSVGERDHRPLVVNGSYLGEVEFDRRFSPLVNRLGQIWTFQAVDAYSPEPVPYWGGVTYLPLVTSFIPRAIYPAKPQERAGHAFGLRYGLVHDENEPTSFNIPWIVELLANFGPYGVVIGMAVFGGLLGILDRLFNRTGLSDAEFLVGLTVIFKLTYQESNFSVMTGSLIPLFVSLYLYFWLGSKVLTRLAGVEKPAS